jgi:hypothetical protein
VFNTSDKYYAVDANFNLTKLLAQDNSDPQQPATFDIGTSAVAESDADPLIMLRWGRWSGGDAIRTTLANGSVLAFDLTQQSLHWVEGADSATPPVIPTTGTVNYQLAGWTTPTDRAGNLGTLNSAAFTADFTAQTVDSALDITINGLNWVATGQGLIGAQSGLPAHQFAGSYTGGLIGPVQGGPAGSFSGFFTNPGGAPGVPAGVGLTYTLSDGQGQLGSVDGAVVFRKP